MELEAIRKPATSWADLGLVEAEALVAQVQPGEAAGGSAHVVHQQQGVTGESSYEALPEDVLPVHRLTLRHRQLMSFACTYTISRSDVCCLCLLSSNQRAKAREQSNGSVLGPKLDYHLNQCFEGLKYATVDQAAAQLCSSFLSTCSPVSVELTTVLPSRW